MKSITTALLTLGLTCGLAISGYSQTQGKQPMNMEPTGFRDAFKGSPNRVSIALDFHTTDEDIDSSSTGPDGDQWGFALNYDYYRHHHIYFGLSYSEGWGDIDESSNDRDFQEGDAQARVGYTWVCGCSDEFFVTPFIGIGYRWMEGDTDVALGDVESYMTYIPVGIRAGWWINRTWELGLNAQWRGAWEAHRSAPGVDNVDYDLKFSDGWELELPITYRFESKKMDGFDLRLVPYYKNTRFGQAKALSSLTETEYEQWGARLELGYRF